MDVDKELKPCPFCGAAAAELREESDHHGGFFYLGCSVDARRVHFGLIDALKEARQGLLQRNCGPELIAYIDVALAAQPAAPAPWSVVAESQTVTLNYSFAAAVLGALFNGGTHNPEAFEQIKQSFAAVMRGESTALPWFLVTPAGEPVANLTCKGKGGTYVEIGVAAGAGTMRGNLVHVYRNVATGNLFYRTPMDFAERMERIANAGQEVNGE